MQLIQWTLFIDMLGYRDINGAINSEEKAKEFIEFMDANKTIFEFTDSSEVRERYAKDDSFNLYKYYDVHKTFVSDSLIITYYPKKANEPDNPDVMHMHSANALFIILMRLQTFLFHCFSEKNIFLRGGISNKFCYVKDNFAVGEGLVEAYIAESTLAKDPRIVLHPEVIKNEILMKKISLLSDLMYGGESPIKKDEDGLYFLDYLGYALSTVDTSIPMMAIDAFRNPSGYKMRRKSVEDFVRRHAEAINKNLLGLQEKKAAFAAESEDKKKIDRVIKKYVWLRTYHNTAIGKSKHFMGFISK